MLCPVRQLQLYLRDTEMIRGVGWGWGGDGVGVWGGGGVGGVGGGGGGGGFTRRSITSNGTDTHQPSADG